MPTVDTPADMPVAVAIKRGRPVHLLKDDVMSDERRIELIRSAVDNGVLVNADAAALMWHHTDSYLDENKDFPPMRAPYPEMWFEWELPHMYRDGGAWHRREFGPGEWPRRVFAAVTDHAVAEWRGPAPDGTTRVLCSHGGVMDDLGNIICIPGVRYLCVDDAGVVLGNGLGDPLRPGEGSAAWCNSKQDVSSGHFNVAFLAIGLMNCKNVHTTSTSAPVATRKERRNKKRPDKAGVITYRTIVVPGVPHGRTTNTGGGTPEALHAVRGHFKTFTAERPLLGKHVGTYWWGWQVRGRAEHGTVVSDYKLA